MAEEKVKLPRSSYEEICRIVKAYGSVTSAASLDEIQSRSGVGKTVVSANNSFLSATEIIEGGQSKIATQKGRDLAKALTHEIPGEIQKAWDRVVRENGFLNKMALAVKIRKSMDSSTFETHIAYSAGEAKSSQVMTGARAVVDILRAAGVVNEHDGQLIASEPESTQQDDGTLEFPVLQGVTSPAIRHH